MKNAVILHGKPTRERYENPALPKPHKANWLPWLGEQLTAHGVDVVIPPLPKPYFPVYEAWKAKFEAYDISDKTALVGHSAGAEFILRWLSENQEATAERVVLVAPYRDAMGKYGDFSNYELDTGITERVGRLTIFNSLDDDLPIQENVQHLIAVMPGINLVTFNDLGHFMLGHNMTSQQFPELLAELSK